MDFIGSNAITLYPETSGYPVTFIFSVSNAAGLGGSLPHGSTISSAAVKVMAYGGPDITSATVHQVQVDGSGLEVRAAFNYPPLAKKGVCVVLLKLTLSTGVVIVKRWDGLKVA